MKVKCSPARAIALMLPLFVTGCSLLPATRKLPIPKAPLVEQNATPEQLVEQLNNRWNALNSLTAKVEIQASQTKSKEGIAKDSPTLQGHILMRKPEMLRVLGYYLSIKAFDMAGDGKNFTAYIHLPSGSKTVKGSYTIKKKSANPLENLRPGFFLDALVVRGLEPDDLYGVVADSQTVEDPARKHLFTVPEYVLSISRRKSGSQQLTPVRVITFRRDDLLPSQQNIYDSDGNLETEVRYYNYQDFGSSKYPSRVVIRRPLEEVQIILSVDNVVENQPLTDDQFVLKPAEGTQIQNLE
ncbi:MAG: hypothetical protein WCA21_19520 [Terracidiphilus sp.]